MRSILWAIIITLYLALPIMGDSTPAIRSLSVKETDIKEVLSMISEQSGVNIVADSTVQGKVSVDIKDIGIEEGLKSVLFLNGFRFSKIDNVYYISKAPIPVKPVVLCDNGKITCDVQDIDLPELLRMISKACGTSIIPSPQVSGKTGMSFKGTTLDEALSAICAAHGLVYIQSDNIVVVDKETPKPKSKGFRRNATPRERITIDEANANLTDILQNISYESGKDILVFGNVQDRIANIKLSNVTVEEALKKILSGTRFAFKKEGDVYIVGDPTPNSPSSQLFVRPQIFRISYSKAEEFRKILPKTLPPANIDISKDLNALIFTGTEEQIKDMEAFIREMDVPVPQISIEALIVEVNSNKVRDIGTDLNIGSGELTFDSKDGIAGYARGSLNSGLLAKINALIENGSAKVKANPRITVLNGYEALINVGQQLNYKITTEQGTPGSQYIYTRIQTIQAGITLKIVPWVGKSGDITVDIHPEVSNVSGITADGLPELSQRRVDTCIRVKDGETISIGGLISSEELSNRTKVPLLGDIPLIGNLFGSDKKTTRDTELLIFITPHVIGIGKENK